MCRLLSRSTHLQNNFLTHVYSCTFFIDLILLRVGQAKAQSLVYDCGHDNGSLAPAPVVSRDGNHNEKAAVRASLQFEDIESLKGSSVISAAASQILGVALLEFGIIFREVVDARL